jgi:hypothetical protein
MGVVTYTPNPTFSGTDFFRYTVADDIGGVSNVATVTITVNPIRPWQNIDNPLDVNGDGSISPIDVLLITNRINNLGPGLLPPPSGGSPPPFYDVNGDGSITAIDALNIINRLNNPVAAPEGEGEELADQAIVVGDSQPDMHLGRLVTSFSPGYEEQRMPAALWGEVDPWTDSVHSLVGMETDRYGSGVHSYQKQVFSPLDDDIFLDVALDRAIAFASSDAASAEDEIFAQAVDQILELDEFGSDM